MSHHDDSEVRPTITVQEPDPQDEVPCQVVFYDELVDWLDLLSRPPFSGSATSANAPGPDLHVVSLTDGPVDPFSASSSGGVDLSSMQLNKALPGVRAAVGYIDPASNALIVPDTVEALPSSSFHKDGLEDAIHFSPDFSSALNWQTPQSYTTTYGTYLDGPRMEYPLPVFPDNNGVPSDEGFATGSPTAFFTPSNTPSNTPHSPHSNNSATSPVPATPSPSSSSYGSRSPHSATSPGIGIPSPSSSFLFASPTNTTPDSGERILKVDPISRRHSHHDLTQSTRSERGRSPMRGRHALSVSPSRRTSPYRHSSRSPNDPRATGPYLDVPPSLVMEGSQSHLPRRHSFGPGTRPRPSFPGGGAQGMGIPPNGLTSDPALQSAPINRHPALPLPNGPVISSQPPGAPVRGPVASPAIIAACMDRRKKEAKFTCDVCPQTFTARHNLVNHQKVHDGIKDQICVGCRSSFTASGTLRRHMKTCKALKLNIG